MKLLLRHCPRHIAQLGGGDEGVSSVSWSDACEGEFRSWTSFLSGVGGKSRCSGVDGHSIPIDEDISTLFVQFSGKETPDKSTGKQFFFLATQKNTDTLLTTVFLVFTANCAAI